MLHVSGLIKVDPIRASVPTLIKSTEGSCRNNEDLKVLVYILLQFILLQISFYFSFKNFSIFCIA